MKKIEGEKWKVITFHKTAFGKQYAISNHGRLVCFDKLPHDGTAVKGSLQEGYPIWRFRKKKKNGTSAYTGILLHRLVAEIGKGQQAHDAEEQQQRGDRDPAS